MVIEKFLNDFQDLLQRDDPIYVDTRLQEVEEWDSMSVMACMAWFDSKFDVKLPYKVIAQQKTVQDLIELISGQES